MSQVVSAVTAAPLLSGWARRAFGGGAAFVVLLLLWWTAARAGWVSAFLLPPPERVWASAVELFADGTIFRHAIISLGRAATGFALAAVLGIATAIAFAASPALRRFLSPPLEFLRQIPPLALVPLLILWLGIGEAQKVGIVALVCFFPIFLGTLDGFAGADPRLIEVGRALRLSRAAQIRRIVLPAAAGSIVTGLRIALGLSWRAVVGAELIAASAGLGFLIVDAQNLARTDIVLVGVVVIGAMGMAVDQLARLAVRRAMPWLRQQIEFGSA